MSIVSDLIYDICLERRIDAMRDRCANLAAAGEIPEARDAFASLRLLVAQRRPEQVARMERERGLRHA